MSVPPKVQQHRPPLKLGVRRYLEVYDFARCSTLIYLSHRRKLFLVTFVEQSHCQKVRQDQQGGDKRKTGQTCQMLE